MSERTEYRAAWLRLRREWLSWLKAGGVSVEGLKLRRYQLQRLSSDLEATDPLKVTDTQLTDWIVSHGWARESMRSYRSALRSFFGWLHASGRIEVDPARLLRKVPPRHATPRPAPEAVIEDACHRADDRQYLMLMLGSRHGLRRGEIAQVATADLMRDPAGWLLLVHGKGGKERVVPLLDDVARIIREAPAGWVFPNGKGSHISSAHVGVLLRRVLPPGVTPHQLRHRFASAAYQRTGDIRAVQELLGHASVATTQVYTATAQNALRSAVRAAASSGA